MRVYPQQVQVWYGSVETCCYGSAGVTVPREDKREGVYGDGLRDGGGDAAKEFECAADLAFKVVYGADVDKVDWG